MAINILMDKQIKNLPVGRHADGGNLYVRVRKSGTKSFVVMARGPGGKRIEKALGIYGGRPGQLSLAEARAMRDKILLDVKAGMPEPQEEPPAGELLFGDYALEVIKVQQAGLSNPKHAAQWRSTVETYAKPIWDVPVADVTVTQVRNLLLPIWLKVPETARRVRGRLHTIFTAAIAQGHRIAGNPADKAVLKALLPSQKNLPKGHHAAAPSDDMVAIWAKLCELESVSALALRFLILTGLRTKEARLTVWPEIDFEQAILTVPAIRMKGKKEHRVPLSTGALDVLRKAKRFGTKYVFPGGSGDGHLSEMAMLMCLKGFRPDLTVHGFRSTLRDWSEDEAGYVGAVGEIALAHKLGKVERAYRRGDALDQRRALMQDWSDKLEALQKSDK